MDNNKLLQNSCKDFLFHSRPQCSRKPHPCPGLFVKAPVSGPGLYKSLPDTLIRPPVFPGLTSQSQTSRNTCCCQSPHVHNTPRLSGRRCGSPAAYPSGLSAFSPTSAAGCISPASSARRVYNSPCSPSSAPP